MKIQMKLVHLCLPLGAPKGGATREGWTYRREFEHVSVLLDVEKKTAKIDWK